MSSYPVPPAFAGRLRGVRRRTILNRLLVAGPFVTVLATTAHRFAGMVIATLAVAIAVGAVLTWAGLRARGYSVVWMARQLNALLPELEDSVGLVLGPPSGDVGLHILQRERMLHRLQGLAWPDLRPPIPRRFLTWLWLVAGTLALAISVVQSPFRDWRAGDPHSVSTESRSEVTTVKAISIEVNPPDYTGLSRQHLESLDAKVPVDSRMRWELGLDPTPAVVGLVFHDGTRVSLALDGSRWVGERVISASTLYRLDVAGAPKLSKDKAWRIDAIPDRPPEVIVHRPEKTLNALDEGQKTWDLAFEARDDYGLGEAELSISLAQGSGEQIKVTERKVPLEGDGDRRLRSYHKTLDLSALGFSKGDDLIVRLSVTDNHVPEPNRTTSASFILRWPPPESKESEGMDGIVQKAIPAYFRSERQIIIDSEALEGERPSLDDPHFASRSDDLGVDQKILRLRYGQFLGEEFEGGAEHAPPANPNGKPDAVATTGGASDALKLAPPDHVDAPAAAFGREGNTLAEYGHVHDKPGAATLLDPETKRILKLALGEMWQAELKLRQSEPDQALPFEYKALEYIKQVQQAERIYLARASLDLPQVDPARRLSGDRSAVTDRNAVPASAAPDASPLPAAWEALQQRAPPDFVVLGAWVRAHQASLPDPLGLISAIDSLQREPACSECRVALQAHLWPLLPVPAAAVAPRAAPDAAGAAYLDALRGPPS